MRAPVQVFYSYSHADEALRDKLDRHLSLLRRSGVIAGWHDRRITPGGEWKDAIDEHLRTAQVILLLVSSDFLASDYCWDIEMKIALERHDRGEAVVIPIILRAVDWSGAPFARLQALPKNAKPVASWDDEDEAFADVARGIRMAVERRPAEVSAAPTPPPQREQQRHLDAGLPAQVTLGEIAELLVLVRRTESPGLKAQLADAETAVREEDVRTRPFMVEFPVDPAGRLRPLTLTLRIDSPGFDPPQQTKRIAVPPDRDSEMYTFLLTPRAQGDLRVSLEAMVEDVSCAARVLRTSASSRAPAMPSPMIVVSMPLFTVASRTAFAAAAAAAPAPAPAPMSAPSAPPARPAPIEMPRRAPAKTSSWRPAAMAAMLAVAGFAGVLTFYQMNSGSSTDAMPPVAANRPPAPRPDRPGPGRPVQPVNPPKATAPETPVEVATAAIVFEDENGKPIADADIHTASGRIVRTDAAGIARVPVDEAGKAEVSVVKDGQLLARIAVARTDKSARVFVREDLRRTTRFDAAKKRTGDLLVARPIQQKD